MRTQYTFYDSYWQAIKRLRRKDDRLSAFEAITAYALDGETIDMTDAAEAIFVLVKPYLDAAAKKSEARKTSVRCPQDTDKIPARPSQDIGNNGSAIPKDKGQGKDKGKEQVLGSTRFKPPTVDEVRAYCEARGNNVDPQKFVDYYSSNGWRVGRNPMRDWKAAVRSTWEKDERSSPKREKDFADLWREMDD